MEILLDRRWQIFASVFWMLQIGQVIMNYLINTFQCASISPEY